MSIKDPHHPDFNPLAQAKDPLDIGSTWKAKTEEVVKNNAAKISTAEILENKNYLRHNVCSDGRGIQEGVASLGGSAGTLLAMYCSLKEIFKDYDPEKIVKIMKEFVWDIKIYLHDDVHTQNHNNWQHPCDCHNIWCGAVDLLLKNNNITTNENDNIWLNTKEKSLRRNFLKENSQLTILEGEHREESIIRIKKETTQQDDKMGENQNTIPIYIYNLHTKKKTEDKILFSMKHEYILS